MKSFLYALSASTTLFHLKATGKPADCAIEIDTSDNDPYDYLKILK